MFFEGLHPWSRCFGRIDLEGDDGRYWDLHNWCDVLRWELDLGRERLSLLLQAYPDPDQQGGFGGEVGLHLEFQGVRELKLQQVMDFAVDATDIFEGLDYVPGEQPELRIRAGEVEAEFNAQGVRLVVAPHRDGA